MLLGALLSCFVALVGFTVISNILVYFALRRRGVPLIFGLSGLPSYLYKRCLALPDSAGNRRLVLLSRWSNITFAVLALTALLFVPIMLLIRWIVA